MCEALLSDDGRPCWTWGSSVTGSSSLFNTFDSRSGYYCRTHTHELKTSQKRYMAAAARVMELEVDPEVISSIVQLKYLDGDGIDMWIARDSTKTYVAAMREEAIRRVAHVKRFYPRTHGTCQMSQLHRTQSE